MVAAIVILSVAGYCVIGWATSVIWLAHHTLKDKEDPAAILVLGTIFWPGLWTGAIYRYSIVKPYYWLKKKHGIARLSYRLAYRLNPEFLTQWKKIHYWQGGNVWWMKKGIDDDRS